MKYFFKKSAFYILIPLLIGSISCNDDDPVETKENEAPIISNQVFTLSENSPLNTIVGTVLATDPDGDNLSFKILEGNAAGTFAIEAGTGELRVVGTVDFEKTPSYNITIEVSDGSLASQATMNIEITDIEEKVGTCTSRNISASSLTEGLIENWGVISRDDGDEDTHYEYDFYLIDGEFSQSDGDYTGINSTILVYFELLSLGPEGFSPGVFHYVEEESPNSEFADKNAFSWARIGTWSEGQTLEGDITENLEGFYFVNGGTIEVIENSENNYTINFDVQYSEIDVETSAVLPNKCELSFTYTGEFLFDDF